MSHFPFSTVLNKDIQMERRRFSTSICPPIEIPATAAYPTHPCLPPGIRCVSWRREHPLGTVPSQAGISWGTGDWHAPKSPTAVLGGPRAPGRASIIHCLLFTNNPPTAHTGVSFCPLCCCVLPISPFLCPPSPHTHISSYCFAILELLHSERAWRRPGCRARSALKRLLVQLVIAGIIRV